MTKLKNVLSSPGKIAIFALCVILVAALLAFGEFIFTQSYRLLVAPDGQNIYDTRNCGSI